MDDINEMLGVSEKSEDVKQTDYSNFNNSNNDENKIGGALKIIGKLTLFLGIIIGLIIGLTLSTPDATYSSLTDPNPLRWVYGLTIIISSFVSGILFLGFGEVIIILDRIEDNALR